MLEELITTFLNASDGCIISLTLKKNFGEIELKQQDSNYDNAIIIYNSKLKDESYHIFNVINFSISKEDLKRSNTKLNKLIKILENYISMEEFKMTLEKGLLFAN